MFNGSPILINNQKNYIFVVTTRWFLELNIGMTLMVVIFKGATCMICASSKPGQSMILKYIRLSVFGEIKSSLLSLNNMSVVLSPYGFESIFYDDWS